MAKTDTEERETASEAGTTKLLNGYTEAENYLKQVANLMTNNPEVTQGESAPKKDTLPESTAKQHMSAIDLAKQAFDRVSGRSTPKDQIGYIFRGIGTPGKPMFTEYGNPSENLPNVGNVPSHKPKGEGKKGLSKAQQQEIATNKQAQAWTSEWV